MTLFAQRLEQLKAELKLSYIETIRYWLERLLSWGEQNIEDPSNVASFIFAIQTIQAIVQEEEKRLQGQALSQEQVLSSSIQVK